jgi:hypothetical protein
MKNWPGIFFSSCPALCRASTSFFAFQDVDETWMAGTSPAMTVKYSNVA